MLAIGSILLRGKYLMLRLRYSCAAIASFIKMLLIIADQFVEYCRWRGGSVSKEPGHWPSLRLKIGRVTAANS